MPEVSKVTRRYQLLRGIHQENKVTYNAKKKKGTTNIVESETDLVAKFGADKFMALDGPSSVATLMKAGPAPETASEDGLDDMNVSELRAYANDQEVDLTGLTRKQDIVAKIREVTNG